MPSLITQLQSKTFPNNFSPNVHNNILTKSTFCFFVSFSIVWVIHFINMPEFSDLAIFKMSCTSSSDIICVNVSEPEVEEILVMNFFYEFLHLVLMVLLLIPMVSLFANSVDTFSKSNVYQEIYLTILFWLRTFLINLYLVINCFRKA